MLPVPGTAAADVEQHSERSVLMEHQAGSAPIKVCILSREAEQLERLALDSAAAGYRVEQKFSEDQQLIEFITASSGDHIVLIDVQHQREECLKLMKQLSAKRPLAIVAVTGEADATLGARAVQAGAQALLVSPVRAEDICAAFSVAANQQAKHLWLESEINCLRDKLAERKLIEKAKGILMDSAKVSEAEAFRLIQKQSQDKRAPMVDIAKLIISASEMVKEASRSRANQSA
jgi:AmiR/NasT family two-component response regulator